MMRKMSLSKLLLGAAMGPVALMISGCSLASLPKNYSPIEQQTVDELSGANYTPRSAEERESIATQDMFAQTAFWSREYDLNPADLEAAINLAANLRKMGNPAKSIEVAQHTRALYPRDVDLMTELGASLIANNKTNDAVKIIDTALFQRPRSARLWSLKGAALDQLERFSEARENYSKALNFSPNDPSILANVGLSYALEGDPRTAEIWLRQAASLPGASPNTRQNLALVLGLQGKTDEAEKWVKQDLDQEGAQNNLEYIRSLRGSSAPAKIKPTPVATRSHTPKTYGQPSQPQPQSYSSLRAPTQLAGAQRAQTSQSPRVLATPAKPANFGAKLSVAGDPTKMKDGPQTVSEAALEVLRQRNSALRNMPSSPSGARLAQRPTTSTQMQRPAQIPNGAAPKNADNLLNRISQNNIPKTVVAQQMRNQLAQRAAIAAQQRQQGVHPYPQQQRPQQAQYLPNGQMMMVNGRAVPVPPGFNMPMQQQQAYGAQQPYYGNERQPARTRRR